MSRNVNCGSGVAFLSPNARNLVLSALFVIFGISMFGQNAIVGAGFSSGWGGGSCPTGNTNFKYLAASAGTSYLVTTTANGTGNQYLRYGVDWGGTTSQLTITPGSDVLVAPNVTYNLNTTCTTSGSMYYNVPSTSYNYIFKSKDAGSAPTGQVVFFEVQGTVQSVSSVSQSPAAGSVNPSSPVTVTANLSGALSTGQAVYLRYTNDAYATSTVVQMTGSGTTYTAAIPTSMHGQNKTVSYYVFTSGTANVAGNGSNADFYTINLNNNGGSNYSYTITNSPIVVTATTGTVGPTGYATLAAAVTAINAGTHTGAITVSVCGATTEGTASIVLNASGSGSASYTSILVKPAGGAQTLTAATTAGSPFIDLNGADNVTIDGLNSGGNSLTIVNTTASATASTATIRFIADATNNIIQNCTIKGSGSGTANGTTLTTAVVLFSTGTTTGNDNNQVLNNNITSNGTAYATQLIASYGTSTAISNDNITVSGNNLFDFFATTGMAAINVGSNSSAWTITANRIYQVTSQTTLASGNYLKAIVIQTTSGSGYAVNNNIIGYNASAGTGMLTNSGGRFTGIEMSVAASPVSDIQGNTINNIAWTTASGAATLGASPFNGIYVAAGGVNVGTTTGNTIGLATGVGSSTQGIYVTTTTTSSGIFPIYLTSATNCTLSNNTIGGFATGGAAAIGYTFTGITVAGTGSHTVSSNNVGTATSGSITMGISATTTAAQTINGISYTATGAAGVCSSNTIRNILSNSTGAAVIYGINHSATVTAFTANSNTISNITSLGTGSVYAIGYTSPTTGIFNSNTISNIAVNNTGFTGSLYALYGASNGVTITCNNNIISNITTTATGAATVGGIREFGISGVKTIQSNSISTLTAGGGATIYGIYESTGSTNDISSNSVSGLTGGLNVYGINISGGTTNNVYKNKIYTLSSANAAGVVNGITASAGTLNAYNNIVGDLASTAYTSATAPYMSVVDLNIGAVTAANIYNNTLYIGAVTSSGTNFSAANIYASTTPTVLLQNNLCVNLATAKGSGKAVAYGRSSTTLTSYSASSNKNSFYGTNGLFWDGTNNYTTLAAYKTAMSTRDQNSLNENPTFASTTGSASNYLHIASGTATPLESGGVTVALYTTDIDGDTRPGPTGSVNGGGSAYDIGADEFDGVTPFPVISFTSSTPTLTSQCTKASRDIVVSITNSGGATTTTVTLNYSHNGVAQPAITMTNTSGNSWSGTMLAPTTGNATITWTITATNSLGYTTVYTGTSYADEPNLNLTATAAATPSSVCTGSTTSLSMVVGGPGSGVVSSGLTAASISSYSNPVYSNWANNRSQFLILGSELTASGFLAGNITALSFNLTSTSTTVRNSYTIKMGHTATTAMTTAAFLAPTFTTVFSNNFTPAVGTNTFTFTTPFTWDGTSNVVIEMCWDNTASTATESSTASGQTTSFNSAISYNRTTTTGTSICGAANTPSTAYTTRPIFTLTGNRAATPSAFSWSDGSSVIGTTNPLTYTPSASGTFTGTATLNGCPMTASTSVTVNPLPTAPTVSNSTQCGTGIPTCSATGGSAGQYRWYTAASGGTAIAGETNGTLSTYSVSASTTLYVAINNGTCESARVAVSITVTPPPTFTVVTDLATVCNNAVATLSVSSTLGDYTNYAWTPTTNLFTDAAATTAYTSGSASTIYFKTATAGSYTLTANASNSGTGCSNTATVTVFVQPASATVSSSANNLCVSGSATLSATPATGYATGSLQWQSSADNITFADVSGATTVTLATGTISATTYYNFLVKNSAGATCLAPSVTVTVNNPTITSTTPATRCGTGTATLQATANAGSTVNWYAAATGGSSLGSGTSFTTPSISTSSTYYVEASVIGSAISGGRLAPASTTNTTPATYGLVFTANSDMVLNSVDVYNGGAAGTVTVQLQNSAGTVLQTSSVFNLPAGTGTTATTLALGWTVPAGTGYRLLATTGTASMVRESSLGGFPYAVGTVASITNGYIGGTSTTYYYFYNWNVSGICSSARTAVAATVNAAPALTFATSSTTICNGSSSSALTLSSNASDFDTYTWTPSASVTGNSSSGWIFNPTTATTYTLNASQSTGSQCVNSTTYTVNVNPIPSALTITPSSPAICVGGSIGMNVSGGTITSTGTFGTGTAVNTTSTYPGVYSGYFGGQKSQILLLASELTAAGFAAGTPLTSIGFPVSSLGTGWGTTITSLQNFQISMGHTALSALTGFVTGLTQVRTPYAYTPVVGAASANTHTFTTNFTWNGTSNVVIEIAFSNNTLGTVAMAVIQPYSTTAFNSFLNYRADNTAIASILSATTISNGPNTNRPNFTLNGTVLSTYSWSPSTGLNTTTGSTVTANPTSTTTYTVTATAPNTCTNTTSATVTVNPLPTPTFTASAGATTCLNTPTTYTTQSGMTNYVWTFTGTAGTDYTIVSGGNSSSNTVDITWLTQGSKTVTVGYTNGNGCVYSTAATNTTTVIGLDWVNLQFPASSTVCQGSNTTAYGQLYEPGVTPGAGAQGAGITAQLGISTTNTNPSTWAAGSWTNANFNALGGGANNDEYMLDFGASLAPGTYYYTFRYSLNGCAYQYGGYSVSGGGFWDGTTYVSGVLTVNPMYTPSVSVSASATTVCVGTSVTFTATPTDGGSSPSYQWYLNGNPVGTGATTYTNASLANGDVVYVVMTANNTCQTAATATSSSITMTITPLNTYYADSDQDGYGDASLSASACSAPIGYVSNNTDCDDTDSSINPAAAEVCNGIDDNCNSLIDDGITFTTYYVDADGDGFGSTVSASFCQDPGAGYALTNTDCDDAASSIYPGATETCNSIDDDCNGLIDDGISYTDYYLDQDGDGFGAGAAIAFCSNPGGSYSLLSTDCNDGNAFVNPNATEVCNGIDDNCNGQIDEGVQSTFYVDIDADGFGDIATSTLACTAPTGYVSNSLDCNDAIASINPNTIWYYDADGDTYYGSSTASCTSPGAGYMLATAGFDCNDANAAISPSGAEICNGVDDNCDGLIDNNTGNTYYADADNDGYGNASSTVVSCTQPAGYVSSSNDCNDSNALVNPGVTELCNFIDDNCNGTIDEGCNTSVPGEEPSNALAAPGTFFPTCMNFYGTLAGAIPSIYAQSYCLTGEDVWYSFTAMSSAATIFIGTSLNDIVVELQDASGNLINVENAVTGVGTEIMNVSGLITGATYKVGVRNFNSGLYPGAAFSACIRYFKRGNCDSGAGVQWPSSANRCGLFKATYAGSSAGVQYRFTFTGTSGLATGNVYTRTQNSDYLVLTNLTPSAPDGCSYNVLVTNIFTIADGAGNNEVIEVSAASPCSFTISSDPATGLRTSDQCQSGPRFRGSIVASLPWVCGVTNWRWRFTEVNPITYVTVGIPIELNRGAASNFLNLGTVSQLQYGKTYAVQTAPIMSFTSTNYSWGPVSYLCIIGSAGMVIDAEGQVQNEDAPKSLVVNEPSLSIYPNPTHDGETNLYVSGLNDERVTVQCFDAMGKMVYHNACFVAAGNQSVMPLPAELANGVYVVRVDGNEFHRSIRYVIEK